MQDSANPESPAKDLHTQFAQLYLKKDELEEELKRVRDELATMSDALVEQFIDRGVQRITLKGGITLRLDCKIWPKVKSTAEAVEAIKAAGMPELLAKETYQSMSLAAYLRELARSGEEPPDEFKGVIESNPVYKIVPTRH